MPYSAMGQISQLDFVLFFVFLSQFRLKRFCSVTVIYWLGGLGLMFVDVLLLSNPPVSYQHLCLFGGHSTPAQWGGQWWVLVSDSN